MNRCLNKYNKIIIKEIIVNKLFWLLINKNSGIQNEQGGFDKLIKKFGSNMSAINGINMPIPNISKTEVNENMAINIYKEKG